jgi:hypothetical protein
MERSANTTTPFLLVSSVIIALLLTQSCKQTEDIAQENDNSSGVLKGQVFIATKGGSNIKLGLVPVHVLSEETVVDHLHAKIAESNRQIELLRPKVEEAERDLAEGLRLHAQELKSKRKEVKLLEKYKQDRAQTTDDYIYTETKKRVGYAYTDALDSLELKYERDLWAIRNRVKSAANVEKRSQVVSELAKKSKYWESAEFYFLNMPSGYVETKTDADGEFVVTIPRKERMVLIAEAHRLAGTIEESYYWLIWASLDGQSSRRILVSNDNTTESHSSENALLDILNVIREDVPGKLREM